MKRTAKKYGILLLLLCILVALDQFSKWLICEKLDTDQHYHYVVCKHLLNFEYVENRGVAFGMFSGKQVAISVMVVLVTLCIIYVIYIIEHTLTQLESVNAYRKFVSLQVIGLFMIAGSIGNMLDRLRYGYVVDFIQFDFIDFPVFNVADCYVTISVFVLLIMVLFFLSEEELILLKFRK